MTTINGATLIARSLKQQGVEVMFGIVGFPVFGIASAAQSEGIKPPVIHLTNAARWLLELCTRPR